MGRRNVQEEDEIVLTNVTTARPSPKGLRFRIGDPMALQILRRAHREHVTPTMWVRNTLAAALADSPRAVP